MTATYLPFRTLVYRFFFFDWLFRDINRGTLFERAAAWRHNLSCAHWLATYLWRWIGVGCTLFAGGMLLETGTNAGVLASLCYVPFALSIVVDVVIAVAMAGFKWMPGPL